MESLESRVEQLERRYHRSRLVSFAALGFGALGLGVAARRPVEPAGGGELVASRLTLRDARGLTRMTLSAQEGGEGGWCCMTRRASPGRCWAWTVAARPGCASPPPRASCSRS
ncbi:hypothetical protein ACN28S_49285 [Cystobacter fuscus]